MNRTKLTDQYIPWVCMTLAILAEVAGITSMKLSYGFTQPGPSILIFIFYLISFLFLTISLKKLELGFAYAMWSGLGTMLIFIIGVLYFNEHLSMLKIISISMIIIGVMGLKQA